MKIEKIVFLFISLGSCDSGNTIVKNEGTLNENNKNCSIQICNNSNNKKSFESADTFFTVENLKSVGPIKYLNYLKNFECYDIMIPNCRFPVNWINKTNVDSLFGLVDEKTPCTGIHIPNIKSNTINLDSAYIKPSTVGNEALRLLNGFFLKEYPCNIILTKDSILTRMKTLKTSNK